VLCLLGRCLPAARAAGSEKDIVKKILEETGVHGGLIVHLGCGDGRLTAALCAGDGFLVQGLDTNPENVEKAREHIQSLGRYGPVCIDRLTSNELPYVDNFVNLIVASGKWQVAKEEIIRVLAPGGVAILVEADRGQRTSDKLVKPRPAEIDDWTHYLYDSTNNAVSRDTAVQPLRHLQWVGSPRYSRHHDHMSAASAMVSAGGRLFYIFDHASPMSIQLPSEWRLVTRDAFNGTVLWSRPIDTWHTRMFRLKSGPVQATRRLVAVDDRVYVTLGWEAPVSVLDAATGRSLRTLAGTEKTDEIICSDGILFLVINDQPFRQSRNPNDLKYEQVEGPRRVVAVDTESGKILWNETQKGVLASTLTADSQRVLFMDVDRIVCLDRQDGSKLWQSAQLMRRKVLPSFFGPTLVVKDDVVLFSGGSAEADERNRGGHNNTMYALSAETGKTLWTADHPGSGYKSPEDIFVLGDTVWITETTVGSDSGVMIGMDLHTGEVRKQFVPDVETHWFHHRCYRAKATDEYILTSRTGIEFVDPDTEHWECHHWVRGACLYGTMPANGMVYNPPHPCACYLEAKLYGFNALAGSRVEEGESRVKGRESRAKRKQPGAESRGQGAGTRLERGPAYDGSGSPPSAFRPPPSDDWPTYRGDAARSGSTASAVPYDVSPAWERELGGRLSSVVVADSKVFVATVDTHTIHALNADSGEPVWSYTTGGRVDSPPTIYRGRALFGSADGYVYCLRASDGQLIWRFRAAPIDRRMGAMEQVESVWPVHGSVLIREGELWCVAGRSMFVDGGLRLVRLDPLTGKLIDEKVLDDRDPESDENLQVRLVGLNMPVALPDVLSYDGDYVYMRSQRFDADGNRHEIEVPTLNVSEQRGEGVHLFCPTGFLDDVFWHRSYWLFGRVWKSGAGGYSQAGRVTPAGRPLVFNDTTVYGYGRLPQYYRWTTPLEYQLFACPKQPELVSQGGANERRAQRRGGLGRAPRVRLALDWTAETPILVRAMVLAGDTLFAVGPPDLIDEVQTLESFAGPDTQKQLARQAAALEGSDGAVLRAVSSADGTALSERKLGSPPVFDGLAAARGKLYLSTLDGKVLCLAGKR
jgi:outer membrane protein assembly factor BamB